MNLKKYLDTFLPPFAEPKREKPREMLYIAQQTPPVPMTLVLGVQHVLVALTLVVYFVIVGTGIGLTESQLLNFVSIGIMIMGFGTLLNSLTTRVSAGHLIVQTPAPVIMMVFISVASDFGIDAAAGGVLVSGVVIFALGRFLPRLRVLFPPEVTGVLLALLGVSLISGGFNRSAGLEGGLGIQAESVLVAAITLVSITALSVWATDRFRVLAILIGAGAGFVTAALIGQFGVKEWTTVAAQPFIYLPVGHYALPTPSFVWAAILPLVLVALISAVGRIGGGVVIDKMNDNTWVRPDLPMIGRLLNAQGIYNILSGLTGTLPISDSSANLGLAHVTGVTARKVGIASGLLLMAVAFLPKTVTFLILLPRAVVGAILIYTASYMIISGTELIMSRLLNSRRRATVGLGLTAGLAVFIVPGLTASIPHDLQPILGSGLVVGVVVAITLNLLFRIGVSIRANLLLDGKHPGTQAIRFLVDCGADWGARRDVIDRAGMAVGEALEALHEARVMEGPVNLEAIFDEYKLILILGYTGKPLRLAENQAVDWKALMDADDNEDELDMAMASLPGVLIRNLADSVESSERDGQAKLRLQFSH
jgi:xanthine/uracil permease